MRLFLAIDLTEDVRARVEAWARSLRPLVQEARLHPRWTRAEQYHLTLKFLGETEADQVADLVSAMRRIVSSWRPFEFRLSQGGAFPNELNPRVLWVGVDDSTGELSRLAQEIEEGLELLRFSREERAFHPHVTIARVESPRRSARSHVGQIEAGWLARSCAAREFGSIQARQVVLYESQALPNGTIYRPIEVFSFSDG